MTSNDDSDSSGSGSVTGFLTELRSGRPRRCADGADGDGGGEDLFSFLPEEMRLEVLSRVGGVAEAARTSVLSSQWRGLWTRLPSLSFYGLDPDALQVALAQVRPRREHLAICVPSNHWLPAARISSLLRAAARTEPVELDVDLCGDVSKIPFELPIFGRAISMALKIRPNLNFTLPLAGKFDSLQWLHLQSCTVDVKDLLCRCPRLRGLRIIGSWNFNFNTLGIHSMLLEDLRLQMDEPERHSQTQRHVDIVGPKLKEFKLNWYGCETVSYSTPMLEKVSVRYSSGTPVGFGEKWILWTLAISTGWISKHAHPPPVRVRALTITLKRRSLVQLGVPVGRSFAEEIARVFPVTDFSVLKVGFFDPDGEHVSGALLLQLLRIRTTIQMLKVVLPSNSVPNCSEDCDCHQPSNWRNQPVSLPDLETVEVVSFFGSDYEVDLLKLLFQSAPLLKRMTVSLSVLVSPSDRGCQKLRAIFEANASVECELC